jgi:hypothetical protein
MSKPVIPLDSELAKIFGNNTRIFRAMRELFKQSGDLSPAAIDEALIAAGTADNKAVQALDTLERIANAVESLSLAPQKEDVKEDDLTPRSELVIPDTLADLSPRFEEDPTILKESDIGKSVQAFSANLDTYAANSLTSGELSQLQNINSVTISNAQWVFLGNFNQALTTTSNVNFGTGTFSGKIQTGDYLDLATGRTTLVVQAGGSIYRSATSSGTAAFQGFGNVQYEGRNANGFGHFFVTGPSGLESLAIVDQKIRISGTAATLSSGTGTPEGAVFAPVGSLFTRTDGGAATSLYVKETGTGNTGWVGK